MKEGRDRMKRDSQNRDDAPLSKEIVVDAAVEKMEPLPESASLLCPGCGSRRHKVISTRGSIRYRKCLGGCGGNFKTVESAR